MEQIAWNCLVRMRFKLLRNKERDEGGGDWRETNVGFFFFFQNHRNRFRLRVFYMTRNRPDTDPNPIITRKWDPKPYPNILRPAQSLSSRFGSGRVSGGPGQVLSPRPDLTKRGCRTVLWLCFIKQGYRVSAATFFQMRLKNCGYKPTYFIVPVEYFISETI